MITADGFVVVMMMMRRRIVMMIRMRRMRMIHQDEKNIPFHSWLEGAGGQRFPGLRLSRLVYYSHRRARRTASVAHSSEPTDRGLQVDWFVSRRVTSGRWLMGSLSVLPLGNGSPPSMWETLSRLPRTLSPPRLCLMITWLYYATTQHGRKIHDYRISSPPFSLLLSFVCILPPPLSLSHRSHLPF